MSRSVDVELPSRFDEPWVKEIGILNHPWEHADNTDSRLAIERVVEATIFSDLLKRKLEPAGNFEHRQRLVVDQNDEDSEQSRYSKYIPSSVKLVDGIQLNSPSGFEEVALNEKIGRITGAIGLVQAGTPAGKYLGLKDGETTEVCADCVQKVVDVNIRDEETTRNESTEDDDNEF